MKNALLAVALLFLGCGAAQAQHHNGGYHGPVVVNRPVYAPTYNYNRVYNGYGYGFNYGYGVPYYNPYYYTPSSLYYQQQRLLLSQQQYLYWRFLTYGY